jgi:hypothetical protein
MGASATNMATTDVLPYLYVSRPHGKAILQEIWNMILAVSPRHTLFQPRGTTQLVDHQITKGSTGSGVWWGGVGR